MRAATYHTLIGLLTASGLRIGEAIKLDRDDIDWTQGVLHIRESKFGKSRLVPLQDSATKALREYDTLRKKLMPRPKDPALFIALTAKRLIYACVHPVFRALVDAAGVGLDAPHRPRLHELRHTFAVRALLHWHRTEDNVQARIPSLFRPGPVDHGRFSGCGADGKRPAPYAARSCRYPAPRRNA